MKKIILINPEGQKIIGDKTMPFGLLAISALLHMEYDVEIIDRRFEPSWRNRLFQSLKKGPLCVGITSLTGRQIASGLEISRHAKKNSKSTVVWGGVHPTFMPAQTLENSNIDVVVAGEGDFSFPEFVKRFAAGKSLDGIPGLWHKRDEQIIKGQVNKPLNINDLPRMPYHLIKVERYIENGPYGRVISILTSRGCPHRCTFCYNTGFYNRSWQGLKPESTNIEEIVKLLKQYHIDHLQIMDDHFFVDLERAEKIIHLFHSELPKMTYTILGMHVRSVLKMGQDYIDRMYAYGCRRFSMSVESGSQGILDSILKKDFQLDELFHVNRMLAKSRIHTMYGFMSALPDETEEDLKKTIEVMFQLKRDNPFAGYGTIRPYVPYPGSELFHLYTKRGYRAPQVLEEWVDHAWYNFMNIEIPWISKQKKRELSNLYYSTILINPDHMFVRSRFFHIISKLLRPLMENRVRNLDLGLYSIIPRFMSFLNVVVLNRWGKMSKNISSLYE